MTDIIGWCNQNNGFLTGILSIVGLLLSSVAIVISIRTARLPYKRKLILSSSILISIVQTGLTAEPIPMWLQASVANAGNRTINLTYLGYAIKNKKKVKRLYPINREFECKGIIDPSEMKCVQFSVDELVKGLSSVDPKLKLFVYATDSEQNEYSRRAGTVGKLLGQFVK
ncbi:MAG: hypothetical protein ABFC62_09610 [Clostridiaceae bacterium]